MNTNTTILPVLDHLRAWEPERVAILHRRAQGDRPAGLVFAQPDAQQRGDVLVGQVVRRSDTKYPLGQVGPAYRTVPNSDKVALFERLVERRVISADAVRSGEFGGGSKIWIQAVPAGDSGGIVLPNGHRVEARFTLIDSFDGSTSLATLDSATNIVCQNTYARAYREGLGVRLKHTTNVEERFIAVVKAIHASCQGLAKDAEVYAAMQRTSVDHKGGLKAMLDKFFPLPEKDGDTGPRAHANAQEVRDSIAWAYEYAPGAAPGTRFGLLQAATYHLTHQAGREGSRLESGMIGANRKLTEQVTDWLVAQMN